MIKFTSLLLVATSLTGCVSVVTVKKTDPNTAPKGLSYYLPQVFLQLTPSKDGSMTVDTLYLPDPQHQYSVSAYSVLGNYTIDVKRTPEGFLDTVSFNSDSTGLVKQAIESDANVRAARIEASAAAAKAKAQEDKASADAAAASIAATGKAEADASLAVQVAQAKVNYLNSLAGTPNEPNQLRDQVVAAELALREAQVTYSAAQAAHTENVTRYGAANAPGGSEPKAPEPVFLKVTMTENSVIMKKAFEQQDRVTWTIPVEPKDPVEFAIAPSAVVMRPAARTGALVYTVRSTLPVLGLALTKMTDLATGAEVPAARRPISAAQPDTNSIEIDLPKATPAGTYQLYYDVTVKEKDKEVAKPAILMVRVER